MSMEISHADFLEIVENAGYYDFNVRPYSGRCMYGKYCLGIVGSISDLIDLVIAVSVGADANNDNAVNFMDYLNDVSTDSMGYDTVFYWQRVQLTDVPEDDD